MMSSEHDEYESGDAPSPKHSNASNQSGPGGSPYLRKPNIPVDERVAQLLTRSENHPAYVLPSRGHHGGDDDRDSDKGRISDSIGQDKVNQGSTHLGEKRKSDGGSDGVPEEKKSKLQAADHATKAAAQKKPLPGISMKLGGQKPKEQDTTLKKSQTVASVFGGDDSSDEEEEMPREARMRMKNIGRNTPTSAGPNSFNKGRIGFSDNARLSARKLKEAADKAEAGD
ncbi:PREDICTED: PEST proteolytic signal-containing nuclear protein-like [Priapulus caudatus]|uniref:PEST proteolytic signal-containing nuclear protein n=1 Tax=Priapulus caudatus TaxID=37621 RepID=A0ABM1F0R4_PRICU|nr:PREDICTED: PEST proteolytic signal-containing nuclear protein-like [Priapulus caudatus]